MTVNTSLFLALFQSVVDHFIDYLWDYSLFVNVIYHFTRVVVLVRVVVVVLVDRTEK